MIIDHIVAMFPPEVRQSDAMKAVIALTQTLFEQLNLTKAQLQSIQQQLQSTQEQLSKAHEKIKTLEDEIAKLRKTPKRPKFSPNKMQPRERSKGSQDSSNTIQPNDGSSFAKKEVSEIKVELEDIPAGSRFKGYQTFDVQEISIIAHAITYKLAVWQTPTGTVLRAKIPRELEGQHFGPTLRAFATSLYAMGMTQPTVHELLNSIGIDMSSGQVNNIFLNEAEGYSNTSEAILATGLKEASYVRTDDTGDKHKHKSGYCTHIGGEYFAYYKTSYSKSRENFLRILLQGKEGYHINDAMIWHLFESGVKDDVLNLFEELKGKNIIQKEG